MAQKAENIYHLGLYSASLLTSGSDTKRLLSSTDSAPGAEVSETEGNQQGNAPSQKF